MSLEIGDLINVGSGIFIVRSVNPIMISTSISGTPFNLKGNYTRVGYNIYYKQSPFRLIRRFVKECLSL